MRIQQNPKDSLRIETRQYAFEFRWKRLMAVLWVKRTHQRYLFFPGGACNPVGAHDKTLAFGKPSVKPNSDALVVRFSERSSIWKPKHNTYVFREDSIEFHYEVHGECRIERAHFFRGYVGDGERGMACDVDEIYSTAPNFQEKLNFHPGESFCISAGNVLEMPVGGQALASPCYCMGFHDRRDRKYLSVGLATVPGQWTWDSFQWNPPVSFPVTPLACDNALAGGFAAVYDGKLRVNGIWQSPRLVMTFARDREDVLRRYLGHCCQRGYLPKPRRRRVVSWWREPTYCTWHDQNGLAASKVGFDVVKIGPASFDLCTQKLCDRWVRLLERQHCKPGIVILDATWSTNLNSGEPDPAKWRDMRGWIDACHERDIHVFVWTVAWATEGLPLNECINGTARPWRAI